MSDNPIGFKMRKIRVPLDHILPVRQIKDVRSKVERYKTILSSIKAVGLIEPLMIYPHQDKPDTYLLLDGHLRLQALKELGETVADCLVANDDESYTYNARINRVSPIQEHRMIKKAIQNGVSPERIATALNKPLQAVRACLNLLNGINEEAADLLKDKPISTKVLHLLKQVTGIRQIEIAEFMISANNFTLGYAEAMVMGTPKDQLVTPEKPKKKKGLSREEIARLEQEMEMLGKDFRAVEQSYAENVLNLTFIRGYAKKLLENAKVTKFLKSNYPDILGEFEVIVAAETL
jgi:ParB/RepB/Spo0J family partition protein